AAGIKSHSIKGPGPLEPGTTYRLFGRWRTYRDAPQFHFTSAVVSEPQDEYAIKQYLQRLPGVGVSTANRIFEEFGQGCLEHLRNAPEIVAASIPRLTGEKAYECARILKDQQRLEKATIDLISVVANQGFPKGIENKIIKRYGNRGAELIRLNPYLLMQFKGCGFARADKLYCDLGLNPKRLKRQALCAWHAIAQQSNQTGSTWHYVGVVQKALADVDGTPLKLAKVMRLSAQGRMLATLMTDGEHGDPDIFGTHQWVAEWPAARAEATLADLVAEAMREECGEHGWPDPQSIDGLYDHQKEQLGNAFASGSIGILGGGPGTGKSYSTALLVKELLERFGGNGIVLGAPTGKAAVRLTEAMSEMGIFMAARTWHSILGIESTDPWRFIYRAGNPLPAKVMLIDEASMLDLSMMKSILSARPRNCSVLIVGDINQLLPVGGGAPLRDMIAAGVPYGELTETHRNAGEIVQACSAIKCGGKWWKPATKPDFEAGQNLIIKSESTPEKQIEATLKAIQQAAKLEFDPVWDVQVVTAVNQKSEISRMAMNLVLQDQLNPNPEIKGTPFRLGDKVVNRKNTWMDLSEHDSCAPDAIRNDSGKVYVANGDSGKVIECYPNRMTIELANPWRVVTTGRSTEAKGDDDDAGTGCTWELGYALSVHLSQGSGFPVVIVMLDDSGSARRVCSREWIYTAISRAKTLCILVGQKGVANSMCKVTKIKERKTFLRELIIEKKNTQTRTMNKATLLELKAEVEAEPTETEMFTEMLGEI
ncbi:MAG: AAA family ATPase, partial [Rubripirellula sp.]